MDVDESLEDEYCSDLIFDFSEFLDHRESTDCKLTFLDDNHTQLYCHKGILANASGFFFNAFTAGMEEEKKAEVEIKCNPLNLFPEVVKFLYSSTIDINDDNIMAILQISYFYDIQILEDYIENQLSSETASKIILYTKSCYDNELTDSLNLLIPFIANNYQSIPINEFSINLDTITFCKVLSTAIEIGTFNGDIKNEINMFLNGATPNKEEEIEIKKVITNYRTVS